VSTTFKIEYAEKAHTSRTYFVLPRSTIPSTLAKG